MDTDPVNQPNPTRSDGGIAVERRGQGRSWLVGGALLLCLLVAGAVAMLVDIPVDKTVDVVAGESPVDDLLGWIPSNEITGRVFAAWSPDTDLSTPVATSSLQQTLSLEPMPRTLGHTVEWEQRFGWQLGQVTSWASAGGSADISILGGAFDFDLIRQRLVAAGYTTESYREAVIYSVAPGPGDDLIQSGDSIDAARAIAIFDDRLITSSSVELVQASIDAARDRSESLADLPSIRAALQTLAPLNGMVAVDQSVLAAACVPGSTPHKSSKGDARDYVFVGYGRVGSGGHRRTLVAVSLPDVSVASSRFVDFENGWYDGFANAGGAGGSISAYGSLTNVSQTGRMLVAELVDGRDEGWVRAGIRFAIPVCELSMAIAPAATPDAAHGQAALSMDERLLESLPPSVAGGTPITADFEGAGRVAAINAPPDGSSLEEIDAWEEAIGPLPAFSDYLRDPAQMQVWSATFGLSISSIRGLGEYIGPDGKTVGLLIGPWDVTALTARLSKLGYDWIDLGDVRHFAFEAGDVSGRLPNPVWKNIAIYGDRIWFSEDQRLMRDVIDLALGQ